MVADAWRLAGAGFDELSGGLSAACKNATDLLTVREAQANSHKDKGWEAVTDAAVRTVSKERTGVVFLLWGAKAQAKEKLIDKSRGHSVLKCPHPSGLSAHRGFYGCKHFSKANDLLGGNGHGIDWQL